MPILQPLQGEIILAIITILHGIFKEKWYAGRDGLRLNGVNFFVMLLSIDANTQVMEVLGLWALGAVLLSIPKTGWKRTKLFFGSKVYGSLALAIGLLQYGNLQITLNEVLIIWVIFAGFVIWLGNKLFPRTPNND